jgi:ribosomal protein S18 acetylase RimI-like enzyme
MPGIYPVASGGAPRADCLAMRIERSRAAADIDAAAQIWAEATAARDGDDEVAELADSRPIIQGVLDRSPGSLLLVARTDNGEPLAFAAVEPATGPGRATAELCYFGVSPPSWGQGVGERMLRGLADELAAGKFTVAELSVYVDNVRATRLYERLGWRAFGDPTPHVRTGKPEQRYRLAL